MTPAEAKFLLDPYLDWTKREGVPVHEGWSVDLGTAETAPWSRFGEGCRGAFVHLTGRGDWVTLFLLDLPLGGASAPQRHLYDEVFCALSGNGSIALELTGARRETIDFSPGSVFGPPLNTRYRILAAPDQQGRVRLACVNDLRILMNLYHDEAFFFDNPFMFAEREGENAPLSGGSLEAKLCEIPARSCNGTHGTGAGLHIGCLAGQGYTLLWQKSSRDFQRIDWHPGVCFAAPENMMLQHFNPDPQSAQLFAAGFGTGFHPIVHARWSAADHVDACVPGGNPSIHALWLEELRRAGAGSEMTHGLP